MSTSAIRHDRPLSSSERIIGSVFLGVLTILSTIDLITDHLEGEPIEHVVIEALMVSLALGGFIWLWRTSALRLHKENLDLRTQLSSAFADFERWQKDSAELYRDLRSAILDQLEKWGLSDAEREIALMLLKGLSSKEIANIRKTNEKTVRQQATSIYQKSGLEGRAQLSAFFIDGLLNSD